jgi:signal transduction histidine kinase
MRRSNQTTDAFLAVVSDELQTPLNAILDWTTLARQAREPTLTSAALDVVERNGRVLSQLVEPGISGSSRNMHARVLLEANVQETGRRRRMRRIKTTTGVTVLLNGDLLAIMDVLYREVTARHELERSFDDKLRKYLQEALFVNTITYENQRAGAYIKRVGGRPRKTKVGAALRQSGPDVEAQCHWPCQKDSAASVT